jgi:NAD(P)-dependent dehydrogenase (short-subunit alcohol dehydrogenase family)
VAGAAVTSTGEISERIARQEAGSQIRRLIIAYGPSADAGLAGRAASVRMDVSGYEWDAGQRDISTPEDAASLAVFLAGDESRTITGQRIVADAGGCVLG